MTEQELQRLKIIRLAREIKDKAGNYAPKSLNEADRWFVTARSITEILTLPDLDQSLVLKLARTESYAGLQRRICDTRKTG